MANQNIGTPRFYVDYLSYWFSQNLLYKYTHLSGVSGGFEEWLGLNPSSIASFTSSSSDDYRNWLRFEGFSPDSLTIPSDKMWSAILGHNLATTEKGFSSIENTSGGNVASTNIEVIANDAGADNAGDADVPFDGFTMRTFTPGAINITGVHFRIEGQSPGGQEVRIGSCAYGNYFDMPHSPELSLTMSHEYDGVKKQETAGGSTLSYANYYKPPDWGNLQAWQLEGWDRKYSGRRVWDLSFNYLSDSDLEPYHYNMDGSSTDAGLINPNYKDNWFTNVLHYTNGGQLPFIFCPDPSIGYITSTWTIPEFAICRFDMKTFKREQVANGIYNIKVKIKESW